MVSRVIFVKFAVLFSVLVSCLFYNAMLHAAEIMVWDRTPLRIGLPIGQERIIEMNRNVRIGLPQSIANPELLRVQSAGGVLYFKAHEAFDVERVRLQDIESGQVILMDLYASEQASHEPINVIDSTSAAAKSSGVEQGRNDQNEQSNSQANSAHADRVTQALSGQQRSQALPAPVILTRYAAQSLYAPLRTLETVPGISRAPMRLPDMITTLLPAYPFEVTALAAWQYQGYQVTAVSIKNRDPQRSFQLDPRHLQGKFYSATFMHEVVYPAGHEKDSTTLFLVTQGRISDALIGGGRL